MRSSPRRAGAPLQATRRARRPRCRRAGALLDDKSEAQAHEAFQRALKFDPGQVEALFQLGVALARLHRYGEAVEAWEKVTRIEPAGPFAQRARAHARTALDLKHIFAWEPA